MDFDLNDSRQIDIMTPCNAILLAVLGQTITDVLAFDALGDPEADPDDDRSDQKQFN